jgi:hypothetical protein
MGSINRPTEYIGVEIKKSVSALSGVSAGAYTATLYVMVNIVKGGRRAPPTPYPHQFFHHDGMYARKRPLPL